MVDIYCASRKDVDPPGAGSAYILSYAALRRLGCRLQGCEGGSRPDRPEGAGEDWYISDQMRLMGVEVHDTRDACGRERFHLYPPAQMVHMASQFEGYNVSSYNHQVGLGCCSTEPITYHNFKGLPPDLPSLPEMHGQVNALCQLVEWPAADIHGQQYQMELQRLSNQNRSRQPEVQRLPDVGPTWPWLRRPRPV